MSRGRQETIPGLEPNVALAALESLCRRWLQSVGELPEGQLSSTEADRLILACLILAQEDADLMRQSMNSVVSECLAASRSSNWKELDEIPWLLVQDFLDTGRPGRDKLHRVRNLLGHHNSNIREWFHYVAWMIHPSIEPEAVYDTLLGNLADKLGGVTTSAGLLAILYPDKTVLDTAADAFEPPEGFEDQYRDRLNNIREREWNSYTNNLWQAENQSRKLIWGAVKGLETER